LRTYAPAIAAAYAARHVVQQLSPGA